MMNLTRRDFLKVCGASAALIGIGARQAPPGLVPFTSAVPISPKTGVGVLIDTTKCVGCQQCQVACQKAHDLPENRKVNALCPTALSVVDMKNISTDPAKPEIKPVKRQCMNCLNPSCVSACTVGALQKRDDGPVVYDSNRCIGCRYCMYACPFGVPTFEWNKQLSLISKCDNCANRIDQGKVPACVEACPAGALTYGKRTELLTMANQRIYDGKGKYIQHIYGEHEIGGTSMMYLAATPFEQLGFPALPENPPAEVNAAVMHATPTIAAGMILALSGMYWLIKRRDRLEPLFAAAHDENGNGGH
jgi:formate dehydrogenase iron-sulfur subunit